MRPESDVLNYELLVNPENIFRIYKPATDNDGVMSDTRTLVVDTFNTMFGTDYAAEDIRSWHAIRDWGIGQGLDYGYAAELEKRLWFDPDLLYQAQPIPGAVETSMWFYEQGITLPIISSRRDLFLNKGVFKNIIDSTLAWYQKWMPWVPKNDIHIQPGAEMEGAYFKAFTINRLGIGFYFEDIPAHAKAILDYTNAYLLLVSNRSIHNEIYKNRYVGITTQDGTAANLVSFSNFLRKLKSG